MLNSKEIRNIFLDFFKSKGHQIVPSAPIVVKNDPTLMFTNAGMNQFKDYFLGNKKTNFSRIADTQKCLRVSGKHNDLEEVGVDHYHHTMFEMLGNWSFGDYFKKEAIEWSWELLTKVYKIDPSKLYVTVFEGDEKEGLKFDQEAYDYWKLWIDESRILKGNKKDNFWEMGETGPCGPCTEIHVDTRSDEERNKIDGASLVNNDHPEVIEIWNNVFMEFNRLADGSLQKLPNQHVDTGMGFERLTRVLQNKNSNYDTDIFQPIIKELEKITGFEYTATDSKKDIAFRVISDHVRAVAFCIADGQLPSNNGAGYVVRRILRRAIRYGYSYLDIRQPFIFKLIPVLQKEMGYIFPEIEKQDVFIARVIEEEGHTFLKTLSVGLEKINLFIKTNNANIDGKTAFELYDTFGFPIDLTQLIASENNLKVNISEFEKLLNEQKERSRKDAEKETGDWVELLNDDKCEFIGYDYSEAKVNIVKYRTIKIKQKEQFQAVFNITPFYAESGGQIGDKGTMKGIVNSEQIYIIDTQKENDLIVHILNKLPENTAQAFEVKINEEKRNLCQLNHSATHLLHAALKKVLGNHVAQKGSYVSDEILRFDFSHFTKMTDEEIEKVEHIVNEKIDVAIELNEQRNVPINEAVEKLGATALFGEKYGDLVRVITFDKSFSVELCGGTHVKNTREIKGFKLISESSVAAGVRRIEAITGKAFIDFQKNNERLLVSVKKILGNPKDINVQLEKLLEENLSLRKQIEKFENLIANQVFVKIQTAISELNGHSFLNFRQDDLNGEQLKTVCFQLKSKFENLIGMICGVSNDKPYMAIFCGNELLNSNKFDCNQLVRDLSKNINGGGGGQKFFATAGGKDVNGLGKLMTDFEEKVKGL